MLGAWKTNHKLLKTAAAANHHYASFPSSEFHHRPALTFLQTSCFDQMSPRPLMHLRHSFCYSPLRKLAYSSTARLASTFVGKTGRVYVQSEVLQRREDPKLNVFKAESDHQSFVFKRVSRRIYDQFQILASEFTGSDRLRIHVDFNEEEGIFVYPYFTGTLLGLIEKDPALSVVERIKVLRHVAEAIQELHDKEWIHNDVKPDNILVDWTCDEEGKKTVNRAVLGDFDIAFNLPVGEQLDVPYAIGNVMWRSPEGLFKVIDDEQWCKAFRGASEVAEEIVKESPEQRFSDWGQQLGPSALDIIGGMTNLGPRARITINQVLKHEFWKEDT